MEIKILKEDEREMEISLDNLTIASLVSKYLNEDERVEFAAFRQEHPLRNEIKLYFKVREGKAREVLKDAINRALADVKELRETLLSSLS